MSFITKLLIGSDNNIEKRGVIWNMIGSAIYAITGMLLGSAVTRIIGADLGGLFYFAFSTFGQQMYIVAYFGMRPLQATDTSYKYSFGDYRRFRMITSCAALATGILYVLFTGATALRCTIIILMVCYKVLDGIADCYDTEYQRDGRLYMTGKSNAIRTIMSVGGFLLALVITHQLILSCIVAVVMQLIGLYICCIVPIRKIDGADTLLHTDSVKGLWTDGKWLFLSTFLDLYIFAAAKFAVDAYMAPSASSYFSTIFIPTSAINLMAGFIIRPVLTKLSGYHDEGKMKEFKTLIARIAGMIAILTIAGMIAAAIMGIPVLAWVLGPTAGPELTPYRSALVIVILGGGFYAILNLLYYVLVIVGAQRSIFAIYVIGCIAAYVSSKYMVKSYGIDGAAWSYLMLMLILAGMFVGVCAVKLRRSM